MLLKRKRSESELSLGAVFSSSQELDSGRLNRMSTPSHLPSRTMKRFRDNRPSDSEVYKYTLDVLYSAQRRQHEVNHAALQLSRGAHSEAPIRLLSQSHSGGQQRSLHSFWNLPEPSSSTNSLASSPAASAASSPLPALAPPSIVTECEDCGAALSGVDDDVMVDADAFGTDHACGACGKAVCFSCSVSNLGEHRRCLACAGPGRGGINSKAWMTR
ncbi:uncharacterized protein THITE_2116864 [Thermothielavioides terrestris NRRL 8126]|uniref:Uncharacterized protein n=1 Tax=Thermothielavioides terrestris (strain ATCC 38088 / NRRL 8126) TaxID=578455 RepID=G2R782_THETT|nr:uncharacterized protein THITE_2116864 [Thermothielavioides terrestris NRRL 8126]AEO67791.1 hypothetical protein THITE_2116864 [Thermothielavioides terrestris NRRL 8126]